MVRGGSWRERGCKPSPGDSGGMVGERLGVSFGGERLEAKLWGGGLCRGIVIGNDRVRGGFSRGSESTVWGFTRFVSKLCHIINITPSFLIVSTCKLWVIKYVDVRYYTVYIIIIRMEARVLSECYSKSDNLVG